MTKKSNKSFSYSRHGQNYEHFLLPFPSFSNQSCWLIPKVFQLKLESFQVFRVQIERIPNCQTHHVRSSTLASDREVLYFPLLLRKLFQYLNSCTVDWTLSLLHYEMQYFLTRRKPNMDLSLDPFPFLYRHFIMETRLLRSLSKPLQWDSFCLRNDQNNQTEINVKGSKWSVYSFEE